MNADTSLVAGRDTGMFGLLASNDYNTGVFGKVTNDQLKVLKPAGENGAMGFIDSPTNCDDYLGLEYYHKYENGTEWTETMDEHDGAGLGTPYMTAQIGNRSLSWLDGVIQESKAEGGKPFFSYIGVHAPHYPANPAPWYETEFANLTIPITPNYNISSPDKAAHVRQNPPLSDQAKCWEDQHFRDRWRSLLSVDDIVRETYLKLEKEGVLDNTYIVLTSDHGYKQGQWRIGTSKQHPYETDVRIPFIIRGPNIAGNTEIEELCGNVDLLPTLLELSGSEIPGNVDGRSMAKLLTGSASISNVEKQDEAWRTSFLIEYLSVGTYYNDHSTCWDDEEESTKARCGGKMPVGPNGDEVAEDCVESENISDGNCYFVDSEHSNSWRALRIINETMNVQYVEYDRDWAFENVSTIQHFELYDVDADPYQMKNIYSDVEDDLQKKLHQELSEYYSCKGNSC